MKVREVLDRTDLASVLTELAGAPVRAGRFTRWRCCASDHPDDHPSVTMFRDRHGVERWRCWSGGHGGTAVDAVIAALSVHTADAIRMLEDRAGITPLVTRPVATPLALVAAPARLSDAARAYATACAAMLWTPEGREGLEWLHRRGLTDEVLRANMVGYDPGHRQLPRPAGIPGHRPANMPPNRAVTYPSFSADGNAIYVQARNLNPLASSKYVNPSAAQGPLPAISFPRPINRASGPVIVTEGVPDGLICITAGFRAASVISAANVTPKVADQLVDFAGPAGVVIAFDHDPAGLNAETRLREHLADRLPVRVLRLAPGHDLTDSYQPHHQPVRLAAAR